MRPVKDATDNTLDDVSRADTGILLLILSVDSVELWRLFDTSRVEHSKATGWRKGLLEDRESCESTSVGRLLRPRNVVWVSLGSVVRAPVVVCLYTGMPDAKLLAGCVVDGACGGWLCVLAIGFPAGDPASAAIELTDNDADGWFAYFDATMDNPFVGVETLKRPVCAEYS